MPSGIGHVLFIIFLNQCPLPIINQTKVLSILFYKVQVLHINGAKDKTQNTLLYNHTVFQAFGSVDIKPFITVFFTGLYFSFNSHYIKRRNKDTYASNRVHLQQGPSSSPPNHHTGQHSRHSNDSRIYTFHT